VRRPVSTASAPKAIGPYSQAVEVRGGRTIWLSGQIALDPATGQLVQGDVAAQTERVMANLAAVLAAAGAGFEHVVRCGIFLADLADFAKVNEVYERSFPKDPPARSTVQVAALPRGARVEIDAVAVVPEEQGSGG
jgi:2-iminobutanoate/2-iminopropanoate deaminase